MPHPEEDENWVSTPGQNGVHPCDVFVGMLLLLQDALFLGAGLN